MKLNLSALLSNLTGTAGIGTASRAEPETDGKLVGRDGTLWRANQLAAANCVLPSGTQPEPGKLLFSNGILTSVAVHASYLQTIADDTGKATLGLHNATVNTVVDITRSGHDKISPLSSPSAKSMATVVLSELLSGEPIHLVGYSRGAVTVSGALRLVSRELDKRGMSPEMKGALMSKIEVETFGAPCRHFPDGPAYTHYVNEADPVARKFGLVNAPTIASKASHPGAEANIVQFLDATNPHDFATYWKFRQERGSKQSAHPAAVSLFEVR